MFFFKNIIGNIRSIVKWAKNNSPTFKNKKTANGNNNSQIIINGDVNVNSLVSKKIVFDKLQKSIVSALELLEQIKNNKCLNSVKDVAKRIKKEFPLNEINIFDNELQNELFKIYKYLSEINNLSKYDSEKKEDITSFLMKVYENYFS